MKAAPQKKVSENHKQQMSPDSSRSGEQSPSPHISYSHNISLHRKPICPCGGGCPRCNGAMQPKLKISQPGDIYEQEADRVSEQVIASKPLQAPHEGKAQVQRKTETASDAPAAPVADNFVQNLGPGQPLDTATRAYFEPRFGHDFSGVRVHTDARAAEAAREVNARAYTVGRDVVFGQRQYAPQKTEGRRLLAHELTHVVQQSHSAFSSSLFPAEDSQERSAVQDSEAAATEPGTISITSSITTSLARKETQSLRPTKQSAKEFVWRPPTPQDVMKYSEAKLIVDAVRSDPECIKRITSLASNLPAPWAGWARDASVMGPDIFTGEGPTVEQSKMVCTGIADAAISAIRKARLPFVKDVGEAERPGGYFTEAGIITGAHTAVMINLTKHRSVVFDWWATMDINDPLIYPSPEDFVRADREMRFSQWPGVEAARSP